MASRYVWASKAPSGAAAWLDFKGRSDRAGYWYFLLIAGLMGAVANVYDHALWEIGRDELGPLTQAFMALVFLPWLTVSVRRLHDVGRSGWWMLLLMVPVLGWAVLLHWASLPGEEQDANISAQLGERFDAKVSFDLVASSSGPNS